MSLESTVRTLQHNGIAVELLVPNKGSDLTCVGVRLRPYAKEQPRDAMALGVGDSFGEAITNALRAVRDGGWDYLDWRARPWDTSTPLQSILANCEDLL